MVEWKEYPPLIQRSRIQDLPREDSLHKLSSIQSSNAAVEWTPQFPQARVIWGWKEEKLSQQPVCCCDCLEALEDIQVSFPGQKPHLQRVGMENKLIGTMKSPGHLPLPFDSCHPDVNSLRKNHEIILSRGGSRVQGIASDLDQWEFLVAEWIVSTSNSEVLGSRPDSGRFSSQIFLGTVILFPHLSPA